MNPSGSDTGFFQQSPVVSGQWADDVSFRRAARLFLPRAVLTAVQPELARLSEEVISDRVFGWIVDAERNTPYLRGNGRDAFGKWRGDLVVGEGWRKLQEFGLEKGMVAKGYETTYEQFARVIQFLRLIIWTPSASNVTCPSAMQDGAARLLQLHLANSSLDSTVRGVFADALTHLLSTDPANAWTSGQWMTERTGGSDVSLTETVATYSPSATSSCPSAVPLGPWSVSGFKWFSSATDSSMTILLARTSPTSPVSAFFAPMRRPAPHARTLAGHVPTGPGAATELNGVRIQRLKNKFGTKSLPTAELELRDMRAWLVGTEGRGVHEIATILTITRVHSAVAAVGYLGRGVGVARAYAQVRQVGAGRGRRIALSASPLHMRTLADITVEYRGILYLTVFATSILGLDEHSPSTAHGSLPVQTILPPAEHAAPLLRILTPLTKAYVCKTALPLLYACMESLGGVGYLSNEEQEPINLSRLYRDAAVLSIWEGTTDVLASDFLRAALHPRGGKACLAALDAWVLANTADEMINYGAWSPRQAWQSVLAKLTSTPQDHLVDEARQWLWTIADVIISILLFSDAKSDGDAVSLDVYRQWVILRRLARLEGGGREGSSVEERLMRNYAIVYGGVAAVPSRL